jgi:hypothetical protein
MNLALSKKRIIERLAFHKSGKPRGWVRLIVFNEQRAVRRSFHRIVYKKNHQVRPSFQNWLIDSSIKPIAETVRQSMPTLEETVKNWRWKPDPDASTLLASNVIALTISEHLNHADPRLMISVSHDHYRKITGGVQLCLQYEEVVANSEHVTYMQIHPWHPLPRLAHAEEDPDNLVAIVLNGKDFGVCRMSALISAMIQITASNVSNAAVKMTVAIHQMLGHMPEQLEALIRVSNTPCIFWLHDFFSICPSPTLQRNNITFCGAPPVNSNACELCIYGDERRTHITRIQALIDGLNVNVVSPSEVTAAFWSTRSGMSKFPVHVIPHVTLNFIPRPVELVASSDRLVRVAYLGFPNKHKGWHFFEEIVRVCSSRGVYEFFVMSSEPAPKSIPVRWVEVSVTAENPCAMVEAIANEKIDLVLHWPTWPETFSFTTFEALAGSAYVITNKNSGNVAAAVRQTGRGVILGDKIELIRYFESCEAGDLARSRRVANQKYSIKQHQSKMSFELLKKEN